MSTKKCQRHLYDVISSLSLDVRAFTAKVEEALNEGWKLHGPPIIVGEGPLRGYHQAVTFENF